MDGKKLKYLAFFAVVVFLVVSLVPMGSPSVFYMRASSILNDEEHATAPGERVIQNESAYKGEPPLFLIHNGDLYLKIQETRGSLILPTYVQNFEWDEEKIQKLLDENPELEKYHPDR